MLILRLYLLAGLLLHKLVWEVLKRRQARPEGSRPAARRPDPFSLKIVKAIKVMILLGLIAQTLSPDLLPLAEDATGLRVAGVFIYTIGLATAIIGRWQLGHNWSDIENGRVLPGQAVVSRGIYRYVRHPIYVGDLLLLIGLELSLNSWLVLAVAGLAPIVLWKAVREEKTLVSELPGYDLYCARTKRFIPFLV